MPMDIRTYLGNRVQQARKACKLTQQELSDQTGVSIKMIQGIESGSVNPSYGILFPIVNRLGLTTSNLFNVEPDENEEEINRFLGKFRACSRANQMVLPNMLDFLAEQLLPSRKILGKKGKVWYHKRYGIYRFEESREIRTQGDTQAGRTAQENGKNGKRN